MRSLDSERIRLDPLRADHADAMFSGLSNPLLYQFIPEDPPSSVRALRDRYARLETRKSPKGDEHWLNWIIVSKVDSRACGYVQATLSGEIAEIAFVLFHDAWGQGLAHEAVVSMLACLRNDYSVCTAIATVDPRNHRSIRLLERLGCELTEIRTGVDLHGVPADEAEYTLRLDSVERPPPRVETN